MKISLNVRRETLEVRLEPQDGQTPQIIQGLLNSAHIPFTTVMSSGRWHLSSQHLGKLSEAFVGVDAIWDQKAKQRLAQMRTDTAFSQVTNGGGSSLEHHLAHTDELGVRPYDEQEEAAHLMSAPSVRRFALFWKPGTGKTGALITAAYELLRRKVVNGVLVVAERPSAIATPWESELQKWLPRNTPDDDIAAIRGSKQERLAALGSDPSWVIVHYGLLARDQYALKQWAARKQGREGPIIIFDESDLIKNGTAQRARAAMAIRQECGRCWLASGTPAPNSPSDYENQLSVLAGYPVALPLTGNREEDALVVVHELERGTYYLQRENPRRMPEVTTRVLVELSPPQRYEYDQIASALLSRLESMDDTSYGQQISDVLSRRMMLVRLCSDPGHDSLPSPVFDVPAKWLHLDELLESILAEPEEKVVIWTRFRATAEALQQRYKDLYGSSLMIGGGDGSPSDLAKVDCRVLVATMQVGSSSIDLTAARNAIYESIDDVSRNFVQSMARINRTGQSKDCRYWFLIAKNTVEEDSFEHTIAKMQVSEGVMQEIGRPGRSQMIAILKRALGLHSEAG